MKKKILRYLKIGAGVVAVVAVALLFSYVRGCQKGVEMPFSLSADFNREIDLTPAQIRSVERIGQWEFLSISDEEMVDTVVSHLLGRDDRLVRIYQGTLRLGIDFSDCQEHWATSRGDTAVLKLPAIKLLDKEFIDEARVQSFYEQGKWDAKAKEALYAKAQRAMIARCMTPENIQRAEKNAQQQVEALFRTLGYPEVLITIAPSCSQP